ncbi:MAG TPA: hypothetical protein PKC80_03670 [Burkholderiaceae bacterium]|nr:hypothetical protein [Burkholderiaceae bacterium]
MRSILGTILLTFAVSTSAVAQDNLGSKALSVGAASILVSPLLSLDGKPLEASVALGSVGIGAAFVVVGLSVVTADIVVLTIKNVVTGSQYLIKASVKATQTASIAVGTGIRIIAESTGFAVMASGQLLAFIPNAIGQSLLYQAQVK